MCQGATGLHCRIHQIIIIIAHTPQSSSLVVRHRVRDVLEYELATDRVEQLRLGACERHGRRRQPLQRHDAIDEGLRGVDRLPKLPTACTMATFAALRLAASVVFRWVSASANRCTFAAFFSSFSVSDSEFASDRRIARRSTFCLLVVAEVVGPSPCRVGARPGGGERSGHGTVAIGRFAASASLNCCKE